jgi:hypothetical protein
MSGDAARTSACATATSTNLFGAHGVQRVGYQIRDGIDEPLRVGQFDMRVEGPLVDPFGANDEYQRIARRRG